LNRSVKIKALFLFLAWTVIFLHGVIPHSHIEDQTGICHSLYHTGICSNEKGLNTAEIDGVNAHHDKVCHFSSLLFNTFGTDDIIFSHLTELIIVPLTGSEHFFLLQTDRAESLFKNCTSQLRAPPLS
jgi:hypothetical protein